MAITSTDSFLTLLEKSQLLSTKDLEKVQAAAGKYNDPKSLARALVAAKGLTRWQAGQLLAGRSSFTLGKFRLIDLLGRGGMGSVFAAEHKTMGRRVALKIISKQTGRDPEQLERFLNEARRIAALDHPNIVRAFDVDHEGERYFLVLEHVDGRDLQQIIESDGPLDVERAVRFTRQAALGLAHAHDRKMIHCDIKPANLIVGDDQVVKILDMGMARLVESDGSSSDSNENIVGTIDYIAPEQAMEAEDLDHRVDIYSLGCTLYFLLTSRPPFGEGTLAQRIMKHQTQDPRPISETRSGVPDGLADVCSKMMAKKPEDRFQTAAEVAQRLERWIGGEGTPVVTQVAATPLSETMPALPAQGKEKPALSKDEVDDREQAEIDDGPAIVELIGDDDTPENEDNGDVKIAVVDSGSFSVRAGASRGSRPAAAKKVVPEADVSEATAGFFADPRKKWTTIISVGLLLLASVVGGSAWVLGGGDKTPDAASDGQVASAEAVPITTASAEPDSGMDLDSEPDDDLAGMFGQDDKEPAEETSTDKTQESAVVPTSEAEKTTEPDQAEATTAKSDTEEPMESTSVPPADGSEEPKQPKATAESAKETKPAEKKEPEKKPEPKKEAPKIEPFKDFPKAVSIPVLNDKDPSGEGSKAPSTLGTIQGPADVNWQLLLLGGEQALKGDRKFVLARTDSDAAKAAWSIQVEGGGSGGQEKGARLWREEKDLKFQFQEGADDAAANNLRNCILQVRVAGESRYLALTEPIQAKPLELDVMRGQANGTVAIKWAPDDDLLRFKFSKIDGGLKMNFEPAEPVAPKTPVLLNFVYTDSHENDTNAVTFQIRPTSKKTSLTVNLQLINPTSRNFQQLAGNRNEMQLEVQINRLGNERSTLQRKMRDLKGEEANKTTRQIDTISGQIWYHEFLLKAHKKALLHYQVVADIGGQELVLVTTK